MQKGPQYSHRGRLAYEKRRAVVTQIGRLIGGGECWALEIFGFRKHLKDKIIYSLNSLLGIRPALALSNHLGALTIKYQILTSRSRKGRDSPLPSSPHCLYLCRFVGSSASASEQERKDLFYDEFLELE